ncbi:hypothetical protein SD37_21125 [Amycolatopsis orientalis]|uniref:Uncharacterized protein n=1 Tax=Amycolatopsis orientalis TaxID=31958 RepID=A0A193C066_AMYOR|nr:hypothetical protein [Amycolatopsis orientalis]ANN17901.1 hypothetical protein SD37_21125 [Amycolatopsis orientalis]
MFFTAVVMAVLVGVSLLVAFIRKGSVATVAMTARRIKLHTAAPPEMVYTWLTQYCPTGYSVEDHDATRGIVILSSRPTAFTWGFFYPAVIHAEGAGTRVDVGIKSKLIQYGPLVTRAHGKLAHALAGLTQGHIEGG